jgi:hypothetical protein
VIYVCLSHMIQLENRCLIWYGLYASGVYSKMVLDHWMGQGQGTKKNNGSGVHQRGLGVVWGRYSKLTVGSKPPCGEEPQTSTAVGCSGEPAVVRSGVTWVQCINCWKETPVWGRASNSDSKALVGQGRTPLVGWRPQERRWGFCGRSLTGAAEPHDRWIHLMGCSPPVTAENPSGLG